MSERQRNLLGLYTGSHSGDATNNTESTTIMGTFKQYRAKLRNGTSVRRGSVIEWTDSDGIAHRGKIERHGKKLYFWNLNFEITAYHSARLISF